MCDNQKVRIFPNFDLFLVKNAQSVGFPLPYIGYIGVFFCHFFVIFCIFLLILKK